MLYYYLLLYINKIKVFGNLLERKGNSKAEQVCESAPIR